MLLQNRVTPFGTIVAVADRGLFTGNRGIIHDAAGKTIRRGWACKSWLVCLCEFKSRKRAVMSPGTWTELFFLDEATAFAAGHRPCFVCRRAAAKAFQAAWTIGNGGERPPAKTMDVTLHIERLAGRTKRYHRLERPILSLPDGAMVAVGAESFIVIHGFALRWTPGGYLRSSTPLKDAILLTPPSTLRALDAGYQPCIHSSAAR